MIADLYDFDKTVFNGESGGMFYMYCLIHKPSIIRFLPKQIGGVLKHKLLKKCTFDEAKEQFYCYLNGIQTSELAEMFWKKNADKMNSWFTPKNHDVATIVCSASPVFQIKPICDKLGVDVLIATDIDPKTGKLNGKNCKNAEKVERIKKEASDYEIRDAYTDNIVTDAPLLSLATRNKYKVTNGKIEKL